jgi:GT2 family glycosyltransferase
MNFESLFFNVTGFIHWSTEAQNLFRETHVQFPKIVLVALKTQEITDFGARARVQMFEDVNELLNWAHDQQKIAVNFEMVHEPRIPSCPSFTMIRMNAVSEEVRFRAIDELKYLSLDPSELADLARRQNLIVSNSKDFLELLRQVSQAEDENFVVDPLTKIDDLALGRWAELAKLHFNRAATLNEAGVVVVTPSFNQGAYIEQTILSVLNQSYSNLKYFVIDGGSTDQTLEIVKKYQDRLTLISEKDSGYPEAVNKVLGRAQGKYMIWMASDDLFFSRHSLGRLVTAAEQQKADIVYGDSFYVDENSKIIGSYRTADFSGQALREWCMICQPASLFRFDQFQKAGGLDQSLRCIADYDLWLKFSDMGCEFFRIGGAIACYRLHGESLTIRQKKTSYVEIFDLQTKKYKNVGRNWVVGAFKEVLLMQKMNLVWKSSGDQARTPNFISLPFNRRRLGKIFEKYFAGSLLVQKMIRWSMR